MDEILCGDDPHGFTKPDPRNIFYICDKLNVNLKKTVMVGDSAGKFQDVAVYSHCALWRDQIKNTFILFENERESEHFLWSESDVSFAQFKFSWAYETLPLFVDDIQMGRDAGVTTVAVLSGIGLREDLKEADHIIQM